GRARRRRASSRLAAAVPRLVDRADHAVGAARGRIVRDPEVALAAPHELRIGDDVAVGAALRTLLALVTDLARPDHALLHVVGVDLGQVGGVAGDDAARELDLARTGLAVLAL